MSLSPDLLQRRSHPGVREITNALEAERIGPGKTVTRLHSDISMPAKAFSPAKCASFRPTPPRHVASACRQRVGVHAAAGGVGYGHENSAIRNRHVSACTGFIRVCWKAVTHEHVNRLPRLPSKRQGILAKYAMKR